MALMERSISFGDGETIRLSVVCSEGGAMFTIWEDNEDICSYELSDEEAVSLGLFLT